MAVVRPFLSGDLEVQVGPQWTVRMALRRPRGASNSGRGYHDTHTHTGVQRRQGSVVSHTPAGHGRSLWAPTGIRLPQVQCRVRARSVGRPRIAARICLV